MTRAVSAAFDFLAERANPIFVKECVQSVRQRSFVYMFFIVLALAAAAALAAPAIFPDSAMRQNRLGGYLVAMFAVCLDVVGLALLPWMAYRFLAVERDQQTLETLELSGLSPRRIVLGKFNSVAVLWLLFVAVIAPFMTFAYLLRGVPVIDILAILLWISGEGLQGCCFGLLMAALSKTRGVAIVTMIVVLLACASRAFGGIQTCLLWLLGRMMHGDFATVMLMQVSWSVVWVMIYLVLAIATLKPPATNRSTGPRVVSLLALVHGVVWALVVASLGASLAGGATFGMIGVIVSAMVWGWGYSFIVGLFALTEKPGWSSRVRSEVRTSWLGQVWVALFYPGPGRGWLFFLFSLAAAATVSWIGLNDVGGPAWPVAIVCCQTILYLGVSTAALRMTLPTAQRWLVVPVCLAVAVVCWLFKVMALGFSVPAPGELVCLSPIFVVELLVHEASPGAVGTVLAVLLATAAFGLNAPLIARDLREQADAVRCKRLRLAAARVTSTVPATA